MRYFRAINIVNSRVWRTASLILIWNLHMIRRAKKIISYVYPIVFEHEKGEIVPCVEVRANMGKLTLDGNHVNYSFGSLHTVFDKTFE